MHQTRKSYTDDGSKGLVPASATMSSSEESTLLEVDEVQAVDGLDVYDRFSGTQKNFIVLVVSIAVLLSAFVTGIFVPSIPQIAHDLDSTCADVRYVSNPVVYNKYAAGNSELGCRSLA